MLGETKEINGEGFNWVWIAVIAAIAIIGFSAYRKIRQAKAPQITVGSGEPVAYARL